MVETSLPLVLRAFDMARQSGKPDWRRMTTAVLKNRLLVLTNGEFRESTYGVTTFREFLDLLGGSVRVDRSGSPTVVELVVEGGPAASSTGSSGRFDQVRPDLWRAVLDYSSGKKYVWDEQLGVARELRPDDPDLPSLPTISPNDMAGWRKQFAEENQVGAVQGIGDKLTTWAEKGLPTAVLPAALRGTWNAVLKRRVGDIIQRWFSERGGQSPPTAFLRPAKSGDESPQRAGSALRELIIECVSVMTETELADLRLPPAAVLRARQGRRPQRQ